MIEVTKEQWMERLRDPESKQAHGVLRHSDGFCCLGHLGDLIAPGGWTGSSGYFEWTGPKAPYTSWHNILGDERPSWIGGQQEQTALMLNDTYGKTLPEIADWVEAGMPAIEEWVAL